VAKCTNAVSHIVGAASGLLDWPIRSSKAAARGHSRRLPSQPSTTKPSVTHRRAKTSGSRRRTAALTSRKAHIGSRPNAFSNPSTVLPGRRRFGNNATTTARPDSNRSACESPQANVISTNTSTKG
jgi:hypothetical protein